MFIFAIYLILIAGSGYLAVYKHKAWGIVLFLATLDFTFWLMLHL